MTLVWPSASRAEDAAALALRDLAAAAGSHVEYRVIGGNMTALHSARFNAALAPRATTDADAGITPSAAAAASLDEQIRELGYERVDGSRCVRMQADLELVIALLGTRSQLTLMSYSPTGPR